MANSRCNDECQDISDRFKSLDKSTRGAASDAAKKLLDIMERTGEKTDNTKKEPPKFHMAIVRSMKKCRICDGPMEKVEFPGGSFDLCHKGCNEKDLTQMIINRHHLEMNDE